MEVMQNEEPISDLGNRDEAHTRRPWVTGSVCGEPKPKQFFYSSCSPWCKEQQEKKRIAISEIVQILRRTKLRQQRGTLYHAGKFCALGAIMHEKYGWDGDYADSRYRSAFRQLSTTLSDNSVWGKIIALNDSKGKSFSEIATWLEKIYFEDWN